MGVGQGGGAASTPSGRVVVYGAQIRLRSKITQKALHVYNLPPMKMQEPKVKGFHLVCATMDMDDNDDWIIMPGAQNDAKKGMAIRNGATIQLMHNNTGYYLQAHGEAPAVITGKKFKNKAVFCIEGGSKDKRANWRVNLLEGQTKKWKAASANMMYSDGILFQSVLFKTWLNCEGNKLKTTAMFSKDDIYDQKLGDKHEVSASVDNKESSWTVEDATPR